MYDQEFTIRRDAKAAMVSIVCPQLEEHENKIATDRSLNELQELLRTLGISYGKKYIQNKKTINAGSFLGQGKLEEIARDAKNDGMDLLVFDFELTAGQIKNIKKITGLSVIDRNHVILEIFATHAQTKDAKLQIEIAKLNYMLPRLSGLWDHLSRQRGGVGVKGGEGEQQIELDRRIINDKIAFLKKELVHMKKSRIEQSKKRNNMAITAALVGYTNAGKSSIMNRLCHVNILEEDKLFATLDSTFRMLNPDTKPPMVLIDTVGFISNLPNTLIDGFKTTLESAIEADLLIIICDISDPHLDKQFSVTQEVLKDLGLENKEKLIVLNKDDLLEDSLQKKIIKKKYPGSLCVSSFDKDDMKRLKEHIINYFLNKQDHYDLFIPYEFGNDHSKIASKTNVMKTENYENGIFYRIRVPQFLMNGLNLKKYILAPDHPMSAN